MPLTFEQKINSLKAANTASGATFTATNGDIGFDTDDNSTWIRVNKKGMTLKGKVNGSWRISYDIIGENESTTSTCKFIKEVEGPKVAYLYFQV